MAAADRRPVVFGEVLFDVFPGGARVLGGAPFNVAWNLHAFGARPLLVSRVGDDDDGRRVLAAMRDHGMDTRGIQVDPGLATGSVVVSFQDGEPQYDITRPSAWDRIEGERLPAVEDAALLYHGTLAVRDGASADALDALCRSVDAPRFVDVNLRPPWWRADRVLALVTGASRVKLNADELAALDPAAAVDDDAIESLRARLGIGTLVVTHGARGARLYRGGVPHVVAPAANNAVVDTVGAGDAFASILILGALDGWPLDATLRRAQAFAGAVVGLRGATSGDRDFYQSIKRSWS